MQAMILAAGYGTRLLPYTQVRPKPLFPLLNKPLLLLMIERLKASGFSNIIINCHHLPKQMADAVESVEGVSLQVEDDILGTGGGLRQALSMMKDEPLLVSNGDIYHTIDLKKFFNEHLRSSAKVTLAVHDCPRFNTTIFNDARLPGISASTKVGGLAFTGLHVLDPEILEAVPVGEKSCIIDRYKQLMRESEEAISLCRVDGDYWTDMGTPKDYLRLHHGLLHQKIPAWPNIKDSCQSPFLIAETAQCGINVTMNDWACVGNATIGDNATISRSIIWDGAVVPENCSVEDQIVTEWHDD